MGIEAENTLAKQEAEERKPTEREFVIAKTLVNEAIAFPASRSLEVELPKLLAEHRCETKRIVLEEQGIGSSQDLEKRHALSVRVSALEGDKKDLQAEKERLLKMLGYKLLEAHVVVVHDSQDSIEVETIAERARLVEENAALRRQLTRYENIRKVLNEEPSISVSSIDPDGMPGRFEGPGDMPIGTAFCKTDSYLRFK